MKASELLRTQPYLHRAAGVTVTVAAAIALAGCGGSGHAAASTTSPTTTGMSSSGTTASTAPNTTHASGKHIVVVFMENHGSSTIMTSGCCPYEVRLAHQGRALTNYFGVAYPSLPNYLAFGGGGTFGRVGSDNPLPPVTAESLFQQLSRAGISWRAWAENYPGGPGHCDLVTATSDYALRHVAPLLFGDVAQTALCDNVSAREPSQLPAFLWVTPNMCNDDHDCPPQSGDHWLAAHVPRWIANGATVFITYDTGNPDTTHGGGHVYAVLAGRDVKPGVDGRFMNHYSALAGVEHAFGLPQLGAAASARPVPF